MTSQPVDSGGVARRPVNQPNTFASILKRVKVGSGDSDVEISGHRYVSGLNSSSVKPP